MNEVPISISGVDYNVKIDFFQRIKIVNEELIGDTYFIKSEDSKGFFYISIHKNYYDIIKRDLKIIEILQQFKS